MDIFWDRLDERAWAAALPQTACALQQSWRYGAAAQAMGRDVHRAELWRGGRFYGLAQVLVRSAGPVTLGFLPRGPIWMDVPAPMGPALRAIRRGLPGRRGARLLLAGAEDEPAGLPLMTGQCMAELPLDAEPGRMRARMHGKWRNRLTRAEAAGLTVRVAVPSSADLDRICRLDAAQGRARGYRGWPPAFLAAWASCKGPPMRLFTAHRHGEVIAAMLFLDHAPGASYQIGWTGPEGRAASAHHLLLWRAMRHFARAGRKRLDLGPLDTVTAPGLARFKLGTGALPRFLTGTGLIVPWPAIGTGQRGRAGRNVLNRISSQGLSCDAAPPASVSVSTGPGQPGSGQPGSGLADAGHAASGFPAARGRAAWQDADLPHPDL